MSPPTIIDKLKEPKVPCTICSKELTKKYMKNHMDKIHIDKDHQKVAAKRGGVMLINDLMSDIIQVAVTDINKVEEELIASAEDQEEDEDIIENVREVEAELHLRDIHEQLSQEVKIVEVELHLRDVHKQLSEEVKVVEVEEVKVVDVEKVKVVEVEEVKVVEVEKVKVDQSKTRMVPDEDWTKTLNGNDMGAQFEVLSRQLLNVAGNDNPVDEDNAAPFQENTRSCNYCNKRFEWMAQLIKHILAEHKQIESDTTDPMWYMIGELLAEVRDEQVSIREETENFSRAMLQTMNLLTQTLTQDLVKRIQNILSTKFPDSKNIYICDVCGFESDNKAALKSHFHCRDCNKQMESMDKLSKHVQTLHKDKPEEEDDLKKKIKEMETLKIEVDNMKTMLKEQGQEILIKNEMIELFKDIEKPNIPAKIPNNRGGNKKPDGEPEGSGFPTSEAPKMDKVGENRCNACDKLFTTNKDLDNHVEAKHNEEVSVLSFPCALCQKEFTTKKHMENHKRRCMQHICPSCGEIFRNKTELHKHKEECELIKIQGRGWKEKIKEVCFHWKRGNCYKRDDECRFSHVGPKGGRQWQQRVQGGAEKQFQGGQHHQQPRQSLQGGPGRGQAAQQTDVEELPRLKCKKCNYVTNTQTEFVYHMENAHSQASFKCDNCSDTFISSEVLRTHIEQKHIRYQNQERRNTSLIESQINCFDWNCSFCGEKIQGKKERDNHICQEHPYKRKEECRRGPGCHHRRAGTCWFAHAQDVERPSHAQESNRSTRRGNIWCAFQDKCDRRQSCPFKHIDEERDFIENVLRGTGM